MESNTYIIACTLFMFDQGQNTKEATGVISKLCPEDPMTELTCERLFSKFREGDRSLQDLPCNARPKIFDRKFLKDAVETDSGVTSGELAIEFGCCQRTKVTASHDIGKVYTIIPIEGYSDQVPQGTPKPHKFVKKVMMCVCWNKQGFVYHEVLESGETVNSNLYCEQLDRVNQELIKNGVDSTKTRLLYDNVRPHASIMTQQKIEELVWLV